MVKPDVRHNYYADLDLPINASSEEISKAYRKLAMQWHPDRNVGREGECISKFQTIQTAHEVLSDAGTKQKYDGDRRRAGLYPVNVPGSRTTTPSNQYTAYSAFAPPPRRTQPGVYQRAPTSAAPPPPPSANGADRFSGFPRQAQKPDPVQNRTNAFKAWQNMQPPNQPSQPDRRPPNNASHPIPPRAPGARPPPPPPPRSEPRPPKGPSQGLNDFGRPQNQWSAFQQTHAGKPGMPSSNGFQPQRSSGLNPNAPAPEHPTSGGPKVNVKPPTPSEPSAGPSVPPASLKAQRPRPDPLRPFKSNMPNDQVPFAEANRVSTPYAKSFIGEQTSYFSSDGLRRSRSTRDATSIPTSDPASKARARSSSPHRSTAGDTPRTANGNKFDLPESSEESSSEADVTQSPDELSGAREFGMPDGSSTQDRPKKVPMPPSNRFRGPRSGTSTPAANGDDTNPNRASSDGEQKGGQAGSNMYAHPYTPSTRPFTFTASDARAWAARVFGSHSTWSAEGGATKVPKGTIPPSVRPLSQGKQRDAGQLQPASPQAFVTAADERFINATIAEQQAYLAFQTELHEERQDVPDNLDMGCFLTLASMAQAGQSSGHPLVDRIMTRILSKFTTVGRNQEDPANKYDLANSFDFTHPIPPNNTRGRTEENFDTTFSPDGWNGAFTGEPDYFAPPRDASSKRASPSRRPTKNKAGTPKSRSATMDEKPTSQQEVPQRRWGSDATPNEFQRAANADLGFDKEGWEKKFQDSDWTWPPPPPGPPSPSKNGASSKKPAAARKPSRAGRGAGTRAEPHLLDESDDETTGNGPAERNVPIDEDDLMDIDSEPQPDPTWKGARVYPVPLSERMQQQQQEQIRKSQNGVQEDGAKFNANLDDIRDSLNQTTAQGEGLNMTDLNSTLPFQSQASTTMYGDPLLPRDLTIPLIPKPPTEPQRLSKPSWHSYASAFGEYVKSFHHYNTTLLQHFESREQKVQAQIAGGMGWVEANGDTSGMITGPTGFGEYLRGVKEDVKVREAWALAWERHQEAVTGFEAVRGRVRRLVGSGMLVDQ